MKQIIVILISFSILSCSSNNSKKTEILKTEEEIKTSIDTIITENEKVKLKECECIDYNFSQKGEPPLLTHKIGTSKIIVCGYRHETDENIILGEILPDSSLYVSGFVVFLCSGSETIKLFQNGEYYMDIIKPKYNEIEIVRLIRMPQDKSLKYNWTEVISVRLFEDNGIIKSDSSFVLPIDAYNNDFLKYFKSEIDRVKNDSTKILSYYDYLISYYFIKAVKNPLKYSEKLRAIGPFDGYLGPIYRDVLDYYKLFEE